MFCNRIQALALQYQDSCLPPVLQGKPLQSEKSRDIGEGGQNNQNPSFRRRRRALTMFPPFFYYYCSVTSWKANWMPLIPGHELCICATNRISRPFLWQARRSFFPHFKPPKCMHMFSYTNLSSCRCEGLRLPGTGAEDKGSAMFLTTQDLHSRFGEGGRLRPKVL